MKPTRKAVWSGKLQRNLKYAELFRLVRKKAGLSQPELARRMRRSQDTISRLETGKHLITALDLEDLAGAVDMDPPSVLRILFPLADT